MARPAERFRRIFSVQRQLQRAAEWALHDLRQQEDVLHSTEQKTLAALASDNALLLGLAPALTAQLSNLKAQSDQLHLARDHQADLVMEQTRRVKQAERVERRLMSKADKMQESARLEELRLGAASGTADRKRNPMNR